MSDASALRWPRGEKGAVSLSFDDGTQTQVDNAIPTLNEYKLRGTFYVPMADGGPFDLRFEHWRESVKAGHEIGNHSMTHPCSANFRFGKPWLDDMTIEEITAQVLAAKQRIVEELPEQKDHSFAYPCGETKVGAGKGHTSYVPAIAEHYVTGRGIGDQPNDPLHVDLACTWSFMPTNPPAQQLIAWADLAKQGKWVIYCFHGVGGEHFYLSMDAFRALLGYLNADKRDIWTDTVINVGTWIQAHRHGE